MKAEVKNGVIKVYDENGEILYSDYVSSSVRNISELHNELFSDDYE